MILQELPHLDQAINEESWQWLDDNAPIYAKAVQKEVANGRTPEQIRYYFMKRTQREAMAMRCEQAARHLQAVEK